MMNTAENTPLILIVEDDRSIRDTMEQVLELEGYRVASARTGNAAIEFLERAEQLPSLIMLDLMMPEMDGIEFTRILQRTPAWQNLPVLLLTASTRGEQIAQILTIPLLKKPIELDRLLTEIHARVC